MGDNVVKHVNDTTPTGRDNNNNDDDDDDDDDTGKKEAVCDVR
jgi:hypothetical protein